MLPVLAPHFFLPSLHFLRAQGTAWGLTPAPGAGFLCDAELVSLGPRPCSVTSHSLPFPFSGSPSGSFQPFQAHRVLVQWPFSDVLCFTGTSVTTYSKTYFWEKPKRFYSLMTEVVIEIFSPGVHSVIPSLPLHTCICHSQHR